MSLPQKEYEARCAALEQALCRLVDAHTDGPLAPEDKALVATAATIAALCKVALAATDLRADNAIAMLTEVPWRNTVLACVAEMRAERDARARGPA